MNKKLVLLNILLIAGLLLGACGPTSLSIEIPVPGDNSGGAPPIPIPGTDNSGGAPTPNNMTMILIYVLVGALILIALVALLGRGKSSSQ